jgi:V8-like Glu-specific endopeptidase
MAIEFLLGKDLTTPIEGPRALWQGGAQTTSVTEAALVQQSPISVRAAISLQEKLVGDNNLQPIAYLEQALRVANAVTLIQVPGRGSATGFMVAANLLMTNNHVLRDTGDAAIARVRFNYQLDVAGRLLPGEYFAVQPDVFFYTNVDLDYTLVAIADAPGHRYGVIPMGADALVGVGDKVNIIQHPLAQPKQIAMVDNELEYLDEIVAQYLTDTLPGSSGSPVFNDKWELIALHHSGGWVPEPSTNSTHFRNEGIRIQAILADLYRAGFS